LTARDVPTLEALKKLERDKQAPDRGFLVVAHVPWATGATGRSWWLGLTALLGIAGVVIAFLVLRGREARPAPATAAPTVNSPDARVTPHSTLGAAPSPPRATPRAAAPLPRPDDVPASNDVPPTDDLPAPNAVPPTDAVPPGPSRPSPSPSGEVELRLNAITQQEGRPVAVLNDRVVREGDIFDGIHVIRIGEAEVEVEVNGKRRIVRF
jgi:hypothetical protein